MYRYYQEDVLVEQGHFYDDLHLKIWSLLSYWLPRVKIWCLVGGRWIADLKVPAGEVFHMLDHLDIEWLIRMI